MKLKFLFLLLSILMISCTKESQLPQEEVLNNIDYTKPIFIQIEAVHDDGSVVKSPIWIIGY